MARDLMKINVGIFHVSLLEWEALTRRLCALSELTHCLTVYNTLV